MSGDFDFPTNEWKGISDSAKDLVRKLLCVEPNERMSVEDLFRHSWLVSANVPAHDLPSPGNMLDKATLDQIKAYHSEFLQGMRREEEGFYLKPIGKSKNKLLTNRKQATPTEKSDVAAATLGVSDQPERRRKSVDDGVQSLKELKDICIMPPPLPVGSPETYADSTLIEGVKKAITFNENHPGLTNALKLETWDINMKTFTGVVNRSRLAESLQKIIDSSPSIMVTT